MKFQTTQTGKSYLLLIEQANELTELPQWLTCLNKPVLIVLPKKLMSITTLAHDARNKQERNKGGIPALIRYSELDERNTEPFTLSSWRYARVTSTPALTRRYFTHLQWQLSPLSVILITLALLAVAFAGLGLLLLHLGPPLTIPPTGDATLHSDLIG